MNKKLIWLGAFLFLVSPMFNSEAIAVRVRKARINFIKGKVFKAKGRRWILIRKVGTRLIEKDRIKTGENSKVEIRFDDGSLMQLASNSEVSLVNYKLTKKARSSNIKLNKGSIFANIQKLKRKSSFQVTTVTAVAGVRGTEFYVSIDDTAEMKVEVYRGKVVVAGQNKSVDVKKGYETTIAKNASPNDVTKIKRPRRIKWYDK